MVEQAAATGADAQLWTIVEAEGGVKLFNKANGKVLDVMQGGTADGTWAQTWEDVGGESQLWTVENVTPTYKKLIHVLSGKALDIVDMSDEDRRPRPDLGERRGGGPAVEAGLQRPQGRH